MTPEIAVALALLAMQPTHAPRPFAGIPPGKLAPDVSKLPPYRAGLPTLLVCSTDPCPWCVKLDAAMQTPVVKESLASWNVRHLHTAADAAELKKYGVNRFPAMVVLGPGGDQWYLPWVGYVEPASLVAWLKVVSQPPRRASYAPPVFVATQTC